MNSSIQYSIVNKPSGISTHSPSHDRLGFVEWLMQRDQKKYYLVHRLDKDTSGALLLAHNESTAAHLTQMWTEKKVQKEYLFVTTQAFSQTNWSISSVIEKDPINKKFLSRKPNANETCNAETKFQLLQQQNGFYLYKAFPLTGKTHQIRLHAKECNIPILGDSLYDGEPFPRLMLHSIKITISEQESLEVSPPLLFQNLNLLKNPRLCEWLNSYDRRLCLYQNLLKNDESIRLIHTENSQLRIDAFGKILWVYWYQDMQPSTEIQNDLNSFCELLDFKGWHLRPMKNRGIDPLNPGLISSIEAPSTWLAKENNINFEFRSQSGLSPGLFLDQRDKRLWIKQNSFNKKILNLFCYTSGFSLAAAVGGAQEVVSVDTSTPFLEWSKQNFVLNAFKPEKFEFWQSDSIYFLQRCQKKNRKFDIVICDPPSFSRSKKSVFRIEKDFDTLLELIKKVLLPQGTLLFSTNYEKWSYEDLIKKINSKIWKIETWPNTNWDYELPGEPILMKSVKLTLI